MLDQIIGFVVVILGLLAALGAIFGSFAEILIWIFNYLRKLFAGPVKTEPFAHKPGTKA